MKWNKEQIEKVGLATVLCLGGLYYYTFEMLAPLDKRETSATKEIAALEPKIRDAKSKIARARAVEAGDAHATEAQRVYALMKAKIPGGQPVAWLPTRFTEFFKQQGIGKPLYRANPEPTDLNFPGYKGSSWALELPGAGFVALGTALAALENQEGLMQITNLQIDPVATSPELHHAQLTISTLVKSEK
ncbi:MAG: hypothetical protein WCO68_09250 [Verrucomicrobiota bacterium]